MVKVAVLDDWQGVAPESADWSSLQARAEVAFFTDALKDPATLAERLAGFEIVMTMRERTRFDRALIDRLPDLRMLNVTGKRNAAIDVRALNARGVVVSCTGSGGSGGGEATAELALALMLASARQIPRGDAAIRCGGFQNGVPMGDTLAGKTLGLVGLGLLGTRLAGYAKALEMKVLAWSPNLTAERAGAAGVDHATKDELLARSDYISIHMVLADSTTGLLGAAELAAMKPGATLVNTSRGPIVDEAAMIEALRRGAIRVALDVYAEEPLPPDHPLRTLPGTVLSPHLGYCVRDNFTAFHRQGIENVLAYLDGRPIHLMPPEAGSPAR